MVASYGDRLYKVSEDWSTDCSRTIRAASLMQEKLAIYEETSQVADDAIDAKHYEKDFAKHSNLSVLFEKVKEVTKLDNVTRRLPYSRVLLKSEESLRLLLIDKLDIPELAKLFASIYGDRLYDVYPDLSAECSMKIKAAFLVEATLATTVEADKVIENTIATVSNDFGNATDVKEHPAELFCSRIEKAFAANSNLSASFEKAKKKAANLKNASSRSAYSPALLKSFESILIQMFHSLDFPEYANIWARSSFRELLTAQNISLTRVIIFARSCHAVARKEQFADSMQKIYEKTMGDAVQAFTLLKEIDRPEIIFGDSEYLWEQKMKIFYGYVANDVILKKEVDSMAASMFPSASEEDLDFAKL
ncbi:hypothetical protein V9T40_007121 [Parthenolecanium corni]|uniref:Uncharacterized protein n=1 Tax=Parthenolecanium corni TaxID=536013 RepID=A0AAN9TVV5_9HEMI